MFVVTYVTPSHQNVLFGLDIGVVMNKKIKKYFTIAFLWDFGLIQPRQPFHHKGAKEGFENGLLFFTKQP